MRYAIFISAVVFACLPGVVRADQASVGFTVNAVIGRFTTGKGETALPNVPLPIFEAHVPIRRFQIDLEGMPPVGPVSYGNGLGSTQATKAGYGSAQVQYAFPGDRYALGIGETLLTQVTTYPFLVHEQSSRVVGLRLYGRVRLENAPRDTTDFELAASPRMHAVQRTVFGPFQSCTSVGPPPTTPGPPALTCTQIYNGANDPELASFIDMKLVRAHSLGRYTLQYGVRYINYIAHYRDRPGILADHDRFVLPFIGIMAKLGKP